MKVKIKKLHPDAVIPKKANPNDACYDIVATSKKDLGDGRIEYGLGFALQLNCSNQGQDVPFQFDFRARSSIHKTGMILSNCIGTGDIGYTGEYKAVFYKIIPSLPDYKIGDRILQMQVMSNLNPLQFEEVDELDETERGYKGWGSSGK